MSEAAQKWVAIAKLLRPQGRRGELLSDPLTDLPDVFTSARSVWLSPADADAPRPSTAPISLEEHFLPTGKNAGRIVLKLSGCNSINEAELLAGQQLMVPAAEMPTLAPDTFFVGDLLGCDLYDGEDIIGKVIDLHFATGPDGRTRLEDAAPLLAIDPITATSPANNAEADPEVPEPLLIPFVRAWLDSVNLEAKRITMHLPPGLLEP